MAPGKPHRWQLTKVEDPTRFPTAQCARCGAKVVIEGRNVYYLDKRLRGHQPLEDCDLELARQIHKT